MCERCRAVDGRRTKAYDIEKGNAVVSRVLCDDCARLMNETYPVAGVPAAPEPAPEPEAEPEAVEPEEPEATPEPPAGEGEEANGGESPEEAPKPKRSPRGRTRG